MTGQSSTPSEPPAEATATTESWRFCQEMDNPRPEMSYVAQLMAETGCSRVEIAIKVFRQYRVVRRSVSTPYEYEDAIFAACLDTSSWRRRLVLE